MWVLDDEKHRELDQKLWEMTRLVDEMKAMSEAIGRKAARMGGKLDLSAAAIENQSQELMNDENGMIEGRMDLILVSSIITSFAVKVQSSFLDCLELLDTGRAM